jgi:hypothetical protein
MAILANFSKVTFIQGTLRNVLYECRGNPKRA